MAGDVQVTGRRSLSILIVEDELLIADYVAMIAEESGHTVVGMARAADDALRIIEDRIIEDRGLPDLVTLDMKLAGPMDGIGLAQVVRERYSVPVLFMTGSAEQETRRRCERQNPVAILQKPFRAEALEQVLAQLSERMTADEGGAAVGGG